MKMVNELFKQIVDDYSLPILHWALKKTGNRADGEDLAQEVMFQIFTFAKDKTEIEKLENLIWKIAHYTWCNRLRRIARDTNTLSLDNNNGIYIVDEHDYINKIVENEAMKPELAKLRRRIADLSRNQREIIIAYYLESKSISDIAIKFNMTQSAVKWHLFDARNKIKERFDMNNYSSVYKPGKLSLSTHGEPGSDPDTKRVTGSLIRQNICLLCYGENGKTIDELAEMTGIPKPYLEFDLNWLVDREFILVEGKRYITNFGIKNRQHFYDVRDVYIEWKGKYYSKIIGYLNSHEKEIRNIGFYGNNFDWNKLLWSVLTLYLRYFSESEPLKTLKKYNDSEIYRDFELRKDGGRYMINGFDQSDNEKGVDLSKGGVLSEPIFEPEKWRKVSGIWCKSVLTSSSEMWSGESGDDSELELLTYWLGIYSFGNNVPEMAAKGNNHKAWGKIIANLLDNDFSIEGMTGEEKEMLATALKENIIEKDGEKYLPKFTIFTLAQYEKLYSEIFEPLIQLIMPQTLELVEIFKKLNSRSLPKNVNDYVLRWTYFDMWDSGIKNFMFAAEDGYLYMPKTPEDGTSLTLSLVYKPL